jgi:hypothetical protein
MKYIRHESICQLKQGSIQKSKIKLAVEKIAFYKPPSKDNNVYEAKHAYV